MPSPPGPLGCASTARLGKACTPTTGCWRSFPTARIGEPAAVWLPSNASEDVVGTTLCIDRGTTIYPGFAGNG
jgi:hypothetical protein